MSPRILSILGAIVALTALAACGSDPQASAEDHSTADVTFATDMIPHHRQAVDMAELAATRASSPEVLQLAEDISGAQEPEIQTMSGWLEDWGEPVPAEMSGIDHGDITGMMSEDQMQGLAGSSGSAFDEMFLQLMIEHHNGAIQMAQTEQFKGKYQAAIDLAAQIEESQQAEVVAMQALLGTNE